MNATHQFPSDYYGNGLVSPEDVRELARQLSSDHGELTGEDSQPWLEAEAWFRFRNSEGGDLVWG